jgi:hypothetical protein
MLELVDALQQIALNHVLDHHQVNAGQLANEL